MIAFLSLGSDHQLPRAILYPAHGVRGVLDQVQDHLLKLDAISTGDGREIVREFGPQQNLASLEVAPQERNHFPRSLAEVDRLARSVPLGEERPQSGDHV